VGHFEDVEHLRIGGDEAKLAAADLHVAADHDEDAEAGAVEVIDAGEIEDELVNAVGGELGDPGFDVAQGGPKGHASGEPEDRGGEIDWFEDRFKRHGAGPPCMRARISQAGGAWELRRRGADFIARILFAWTGRCGGRKAAVDGVAEPLMVRAVEIGGRVLGAKMGELKNLKE
jgi:hypothetical protein